MKKKTTLGKLFGCLLAVGLIFLVLIQLVPYGRNHTNPPVTRELNLNDETRAILTRSCFDCHSNETVWPWYSNIAPASWLIQRDVDKGRSEMNFSEGEGAEADDIAEVVREGEMPPLQYLLLHPNAKLSEAEKQVLLQAFDE